jgi:hypothetical protein
LDARQNLIFNRPFVLGKILQKPISIRQAQAMLGGISRPTLYSWVKKGLIQKYTVPGTRRVFLDYEECMKAFQPTPTN